VSFRRNCNLFDYFSILLIDIVLIEFDLILQKEAAEDGKCPLGFKVINSRPKNVLLEFY
jgi:hypothetical protein